MDGKHGDKQRSSVPRPHKNAMPAIWQNKYTHRDENKERTDTMHVKSSARIMGETAVPALPAGSCPSDICTNYGTVSSRSSSISTLLVKEKVNRQINSWTGVFAFDNRVEFCFHLSGEWKTLYVASNNPEKTSENGPFKVYMRHIHLDGSKNKIKIIPISENALRMYNVNMDELAKATKFTGLIGRESNMKEEDFEKFKQMTREEGIPEENTVNVREAGNRIILFPECIIHLAEICPLQIHVLKSEPPGPQNVTVFGDEVFKDGMKMTRKQPFTPKRKPPMPGEDGKPHQVGELTCTPPTGSGTPGGCNQKADDADACSPTSQAEKGPRADLAPETLSVTPV
ncbi:PREDICTED: uncharacterized protein LOC103086378 [Lipotes vexillifer]|uniref:Uncharacterized protein LOC103086378 n=1 Tax=Lipotes vexillifer TaxID=118797 RepID=A0A340XKC5_LIPVE|nr:PREDICTED: uncharacterized protein LOC103086378 [Lipotes vexillifer]